MGIIGSAAVASPTTPSVTPLSTVTTAATAPNAPSPQVTQPISKTANSSPTSIMSLIDGAVEVNPLNAYYQTTYHIRLFLAPDMDMLSQSKATSIQDLNAYIAQVSQVTIAETGVTGFNIKDMQISTINSGNDKTRSAQGTTGIITITEPNGISFMDGLAIAATQLHVYNFREAAYYLEVSFKGYDANGVYAPNMLSSYSNGGKWIWAIALTGIEAKLSEGGGVYTIGFTCTNQSYGVAGTRDVMIVPQPLRATGNTLGSLFKDYIDQLNVSWVQQYGGTVVVFDRIDTRAIGAFFQKPAYAATMDPTTFNLKPDDLDRNPNRNWKLDEATGAYTVTVPTAYRVQDFIVDAIKHTLEGQQLIKDNNKIADQMDQSATSVNDRGHRESIIWSIETVVTQRDFDTTSGKYIQHIVLYVVPHYMPWVVSSKTQVTQANTQAVQQDKVQSLVTNGFLRKRYDYLFTGLNTEILNFDISFTMNYDSLLPVFNGAQMKHDAVAVNSRTPLPANGVGTGNQSTKPPVTSTALAQPSVAPPPAAAPSTPNTGASPPATPPPPATPTTQQPPPASISPSNFISPPFTGF